MPHYKWKKNLKIQDPTLANLYLINIYIYIYKAQPLIWKYDELDFATEW